MGKVIKGATDQSDALKKFTASADAFQRPVVVDWSNGKASELCRDDSVTEDYADSW